MSCVKAGVLNSWIRSGGDISEYPRKLRSSSMALRRWLVRSMAEHICPLRSFLPFVRSSSFSSKPRLVKISTKMCTYRLAHTRIMFRCLDSSSTSLSTLATALHHRAFDLSLYWARFVSFFVEERARLLIPQRELLFSGLFADYRWHQLSADAWWSADVWV